MNMIVLEKLSFINIYCFKKFQNIIFDYSFAGLSLGF